jgi:hypothetical protein
MLQFEMTSGLYDRHSWWLGSRNYAVRMPFISRPLSSFVSKLFNAPSISFW